MVTAMTELHRKLRTQERVLAAHTDAIPLAVPPAAAAPARLRAAGAWAEREVTALHRRLALAQAADPEAPGAPATSVRWATSDRHEVPGRSTATAATAAAAGRALAERLTRPGPDHRDRDRLTDTVAVLGRRADDPGFVTGFYDRLGPTGLAMLLHHLFDPAGPARARPAQAAEVLGRGLATYSRVRVLNDAWLGRFSRQGRAGEVETSLLGPLLGHGRFSRQLLERLGDLMFGTAHGSLRDVGLLTGPRGGMRSGPWSARAAHREYAATLLRAIAADPRLAPSFASRHLPHLLHASRLVAELPPGLRPPGDAWSTALEPARAALLAAAGGAAAQRASPAAARQFVVRLVEMGTAGPPGRISPHLRAAYGQVLHVWRDDLHAAITSPLPADRSRPDAPGLGLATSQWAALLRESLRGGASAPLLAADAVTAAARIEEQAWLGTGNYNRPEAGHYPASPRTLAYHQANEIVAFFGTALVDAAEAELRDHAAALEQHQRRTAVLLDILAETAKSIDVTSLVRTLVNLGTGLTVEIVEDRVRRATANLPTERSRAVLAALRVGLHVLPGWQDQYRASVTQLWRHRGSSPLRPVRVDTGGGTTRVYTGDPRADGYITGPADDFLGPGNEPIAVEAMTPRQRSAYGAWLASPAIVANNDRLPSVLGAPPADVVPGWGPAWARAQSPGDRGLG